MPWAVSGFLRSSMKSRGEERFNQLVTEYVDATQRRLEQEIGDHKIDVCVGTGGSIESIGELRKELFDKNSNQKVTAEELKSLVKKLRGTTFEERIQELRLRPDRADVIVPAAIVLQKIVQQAGVNEVVIPGVGLKDGVLMEIVLQLQDQEKQIHRDQVVESAMRLGRNTSLMKSMRRSVSKLAATDFRPDANVSRTGRRSPVDSAKSPRCFTTSVTM